MRTRSAVVLAVTICVLSEVTVFVISCPRARLRVQSVKSKAKPVGLSMVILLNWESWATRKRCQNILSVIGERQYFSRVEIQETSQLLLTGRSSWPGACRKVLTAKITV